MPSSQDTQARGPLSAASDRLDSWKEVSAYLKRDVRTVQRWEKRHGLPVHRLMDSERGPIYAFRSEIDVWWREHSAQVEAPGNGGDGAAVDAPADAFSRDAGVQDVAVAQAPRASNWSRAGVFLAGIVVLAAVILSVKLWQRQAVRVEPSIAPVFRLLAEATREGGAWSEIKVGKKPQQAVMSPDGTKLYVRSEEDKTISVVSTAENKVIHTVQVGFPPRSMAISPDGKRVYVGTTNDGLFVIDTESYQLDLVSKTFPQVWSLALTPDGRFLYMAVLYDGLAKLDTETLQVSNIGATACPYSLDISPDGKRLYINYQCSGPGGRPGRDAIDVLDTATDRVVHTWNDHPNVGLDIAASPDGQFVWAAGGGCGPDFTDHSGCPVKDTITFHVFRASDYKLVKPAAYPKEMGFNSLSFLPGGRHVMLGGNSLGLVNDRTYSVLERMDVAASAKAAFSKDGATAYVPLPNQDAVAVVRAVTAQCAPPVQPQAWWPGDGTTSDVGSRDVGALHNGAGYVPGLIGRAFLLDGKAGHATLSNPRSVFGSTFTVGMWIKPLEDYDPKPKEISILHRMASAGANVNGFRVFRAANGKLAFCVGGRSGGGCDQRLPLTVEATAALSPDRWTHVIAIKNESRISLYVDGVLQGESAEYPVDEARAKSVHDVTPPDVQLGAALGRARAFRGLIDEVQVFARALSEQEIRQLYKWNACRSKS